MSRCKVDVLINKAAVEAAFKTELSVARRQLQMGMGLVPMDYPRETVEMVVDADDDLRIRVVWET
jgi:hypothetical protein